MSAFFYGKKKIRLCWLACGTVLFCGIFFLCACWLSTAEKVTLNRAFYFVTSDNENVEASVYTVTLEGGAGFPIEDKGMWRVAYSVYFTEKEALQAADEVQTLGQATKIIKRKVETLYFKTRKEKSRRAETMHMLKGLENCISLLEAEINRLENGTTQEASKERVQAIAMQLRCLANAHTGIETYAKGCLKSENRLQGYIGGIILAKNLRFELCNLCEVYLQTCKNFYF